MWNSWLNVDLVCCGREKSKRIVIFSFSLLSLIQVILVFCSYFYSRVINNKVNDKTKREIIVYQFKVFFFFTSSTTWLEVKKFAAVVKRLFSIKSYKSTKSHEFDQFFSVSNNNCNEVIRLNELITSQTALNTNVSLCQFDK